MNLQPILDFLAHPGLIAAILGYLWHLYSESERDDDERN